MDTDYDDHMRFDVTVDPEARLLAALMRFPEPDATAEYVLGVIDASDYATRAYGELHTLITHRAGNGQPVDLATINATVVAQGKHRSHLHRALVELTRVPVNPHQLSHLAEQVISWWYRRQFQHTADRLQQAADEAAETDLFPILLAEGQRQRRAYERRGAIHRFARKGTVTHDHDTSSST